MYFKPYMYGVGSTGTGPLRLEGGISDISGNKYYVVRTTGTDGNDNEPNIRTMYTVKTAGENEVINAKDLATASVDTEVKRILAATDTAGMTVTSPNWPDGAHPVAEAWGAWGGIKPIGVQPVRRGLDGEFSFPMINVGRIFMPGYTSVVYTWRLWWTLYVDLFSPKFHLEPGESGLGLNVSMAQRETVFSADGKDIVGTLYDSVQDPADETLYPSAEPQL